LKKTYPGSWVKKAPDPQLCLVDLVFARVVGKDEFTLKKYSALSSQLQKTTIIGLSLYRREAATGS
jgi:hypothetical protein